MLGIREKLSLGFGGLLLIIMVIGIQSISLLHSLGNSIDVILRENYRSVIACQKMQEAVERMDSGALFILLGENERGGELISKNQPIFSEALDIALNNITLSGEAEKAARIGDYFARYREILRDVQNLQLPVENRREIYFSKLLPLFHQIKDTAEEVLQMNQANMTDANARAHSTAEAAKRRMYLLLFFGAVVAIFFVFFTKKWILRPINLLIRSTDEIRRGNLDLVVRSGSKDEIGRLSDAFNEMASSLRELRRSDRARLIRTRNATLAALNSLSDGIAICSPRGDIELSNHTAQNLFALKPGVNIETIENQKVRELFERTRREMRPISFKTYESAVQVFKDGEELFFLPEAVPILDEARRFVGATLIFSDVTRLRQVDEAKSGLISTVSHELKTPLTSIRLATHVLLEETLGPLSPKQAELVAAAREDSDRLYRIIESLLDIGRMETGRSRLELVPVNTGQILLHVVDEMRPSFADRGVALVLDSPEGIPNVLADRFRLEIVFTNLLSNALKNTPPGGQVRIWAREEKDEDKDRVAFTVEDSGKGIPQQYLPHIFDKFFRVPGYAQQGDAGLGLAIVKEIVEAHGSKIDVASSPGEGTMFTFSLKPEEHSPAEPQAAG